MTIKPQVVVRSCQTTVVCHQVDKSSYVALAGLGTLTGTNILPMTSPLISIDGKTLRSTLSLVKMNLQPVDSLEPINQSNSQFQVLNKVL